MGFCRECGRAKCQCAKKMSSHIKCSECNRDAQVLGFGAYWCAECYGAAQVARDFQDWRDVARAKYFKASDQRGEQETASEYLARILASAKAACQMWPQVKPLKTRVGALERRMSGPADEDYFRKAGWKA